MPPFLVLILVGVLVLYIGYLRLKLHIKQEVLHELEQVATVVLPAKAAAEGKPNYGLGLVLMLFFLAVLGSIMR